MVETERIELTVYRDLVASWKLPEINLKMLEKEHFSQGIPIKELAKQYQRSPNTIQQYVRQIKLTRLT